MENKKKKYPEGHFLGMCMGIGIAIFSGFGIPISIATNNFGFIGIGPALGVAFGLSIGQSIENKYKKEGRIRPLTVKEQKRKKNTVIAGIVILTLGFLVFLLLYFL
jgi:hypothetical protein